jgi:hypothetical protein
MGRDEETTLADLKSSRKTLVDPAIAVYRGHIVKTTWWSTIDFRGGHSFLIFTRQSAPSRGRESQAFETALAAMWLVRAGRISSKSHRALEGLHN